MTVLDVEAALRARGLVYRVGSRYILTQCPVHDDHRPSCQIYLNDFFVQCHVCGRMPLARALPELSGGQVLPPERRAITPIIGTTYRKFDLYAYWLTLKEIPLDHQFKGLEIATLNHLGWRLNDNLKIRGEGYFIPYFDQPMQHVPFAQVRHLTGPRRFTFLRDAQPTMYGKWNLLPGEPIFLVEGASDGAVLEQCGIPWIAVPSSSGIKLVANFARWCKKHAAHLVYAGDNDPAGDKIRAAIDPIVHYRSRQAPEPYKDWGDFFEAEGQEAVRTYAEAELYRY